MIIFGDTTVETDEGIILWARETFGPAEPIPATERIQVELNELLDELKLDAINEANGSGDHDERFRRIAAEFADVAICLTAAAGAYGIRLGAAVVQKMAINRVRKWRRTGGGTGQHIKEGEE